MNDGTKKALVDKAYKSLRRMSVWILLTVIFLLLLQISDYFVFPIPLSSAIALRHSAALWTCMLILKDEFGAVSGGEQQ